MIKSNAWKRAEKGIADMLEGKRNQRVILNFFDSIPDIEHFLFIGESKHGYKMPKYLDKWFNEVEKYYKDDERVRILFWGKKNKQLDDKLVIMKITEFKKLLKKIKELNHHKYRYELSQIMEELYKTTSEFIKKLENFKLMSNFSEVK